MDGILKDGRKGRLFLCKKQDGHALGIILRVKVGDHFADRLLLFRHTFVFSHTVYATIGKIEMQRELPVIGYVEGTMHDIECEVCGAKRTWWMGEAALERFIERRRSSKVQVLVSEKEHV